MEDEGTHLPLRRCAHWTLGCGAAPNWRNHPPPPTHSCLPDSHLPPDLQQTYNHPQRTRPGLSQIKFLLSVSRIRIIQAPLPFRKCELFYVGKGIWNLDQSSPARGRESTRRGEDRVVSFLWESFGRWVLKLVSPVSVSRRRSWCSPVSCVLRLFSCSRSSFTSSGGEPAANKRHTSVT